MKFVIWRLSQLLGDFVDSWVIWQQISNHTDIRDRTQLLVSIQTGTGNNFWFRFNRMYTLCDVAQFFSVEAHNFQVRPRSDLGSTFGRNFSLGLDFSVSFSYKFKQADVTWHNLDAARWVGTIFVTRHVAMSQQFSNRVWIRLFFVVFLQTPDWRQFTVGIWKLLFIQFTISTDWRHLTQCRSDYWL